MSRRYVYVTAFVRLHTLTLDGYLSDEYDSLDWLFVQPNDTTGRCTTPRSWRASARW